MILAQQARDLFGVDLTPEQVTSLTVYESELMEWNERVNLTTIIEQDDIRVRHFLDSFSLIPALDFRAGVRVVDIGSGAGFPGLPLAVLFPDVRVTVMDSVNKKVTFMQHIIDTLDLDNADAVHARAELAGQSDLHRGQYDIVLARAVARLPALVEYMLPLATVGGVCVAMKGESADAEARDAAPALKKLGGKLERIDTVQLPGVAQQHKLVVIKKLTPTPPDFPRRPGTPTRDPLM